MEKRDTLHHLGSASSEFAARDVDYAASALESYIGARRAARQDEEGDSGEEEGSGTEVWTPADVHVGEVCTAMPAPHASDGGVERPRIGVSVVDQVAKDVESPNSKPVVATRKRHVRLPSAQERRRARDERRIHAFGVRGANEGYVCLKEIDVADIRKAGYEVKLFDAWSTAARNIRDAGKWAARYLSQVDGGSRRVAKGESDEHAKQEHRWNSDAPPFEPSGGLANSGHGCSGGGCCSLGHEETGKARVAASNTGTGSTEPATRIVAQATVCDG